MIPHQHHFTNDDGSLSQTCRLCGHTFAELSAMEGVEKPTVAVRPRPKPSVPMAPPPMFAIDPATRKPVQLKPSSVPTTPEEEANFRQTAVQTQSWGKDVVIRKTSEADLAEISPEERDLFKVDKDVTIKLRSASDVATYEATYGDRELMEFFDAQVTEDIRRFENGEISEDEF